MLMVFMLTVLSDYALVPLLFFTINVFAFFLQNFMGQDSKWTLGTLFTFCVIAKIWKLNWPFSEEAV